MPDEIDTIGLATELTIAWLSNPHTRATAEDVPAFLRQMNEAVAGLVTGSADAVQPEAETSYDPAVSARKSLADPAFIISMIDGKPYKALKRHLTSLGLTPEQYRTRYNLKPDYPMVAADYSAARKAMALKIGLGSKGRRKAAPEQAKPARKTSASKAAKSDQTAD